MYVCKSQAFPLQLPTNRRWMVMWHSRLQFCWNYTARFTFMGNYTCAALFQTWADPDIPICNLWSSMNPHCWVSNLCNGGVHCFWNTKINQYSHLHSKRFRAVPASAFDWVRVPFSCVTWKFGTWNVCNPVNAEVIHVTNMRDVFQSGGEAGGGFHISSHISLYTLMDALCRHRDPFSPCHCLFISINLHMRYQKSSHIKPHDEPRDDA